MSKQIFKITIHYDGGCGYTEEKIIYCHQINSIDHRIFYNSDDREELVECIGTDSYCNYLGYALRLETFIDKTFPNGEWWGCKVKEIKNTINSNG